MSGSSLYLLVLLGVSVLALADCLRLARRRGRSRLELVAECRVRLVRPWLGGWLLFQGFSAVALLLSGNGGRALGPLLWFGTATLLLPFLLYAGAAWTLRAGHPLLPLLVAWRQGGRAGREAWKWHQAGEFLLLAAGPLAATAVLFLVVPWRPAAPVQETFRPEQHGPLANTLFVVYLLVSAAVVEEVMFRHYLVNRLAALRAASDGRTGSGGSRVRTGVAIAAAAALWTLGHGGMVEPAWLKSVQIGLYGLALGTAQVRLGLETAVLLHLLFNGAALVLGRWLAS